MELSYVAAIIVAVVFIIVIIGIHIGLFNFVPNMNYSVDVRYKCAQLNKTTISKTDLETIIYGFLTDQCEYFEFNLSDNLEISELEKMVNKIDSRVKVLPRNECKLPITSTNSLFVCCSDILEAGKPINITKRKIIYSDVLICEKE